MRKQAVRGLTHLNTEVGPLSGEVVVGVAKYLLHCGTGTDPNTICFNQMAVVLTADTNCWHMIFRCGIQCETVARMLEAASPWSIDQVENMGFVRSGWLNVITAS